MYSVLTKYLLSMVHLQDFYYLTIGYSQQATSSIVHKHILRGKKWEKEFLILIRASLLQVPRYLKMIVLKTTDFQKHHLKSVNI